MMRREPWLHSCLLLAAGLFCAAAGPQRGLGAEAADPASEAETATTAPAAATAPDAAALKRGVEALLAVVNADDNHTGLVFPLISTRKIVDHKDVEVRYSLSFRSIRDWP